MAIKCLQVEIFIWGERERGDSIEVVWVEMKCG